MSMTNSERRRGERRALELERQVSAITSELSLLRAQLDTELDNTLEDRLVSFEVHLSALEKLAESLFHSHQPTDLSANTGRIPDSLPSSNKPDQAGGGS